MYSIPTRLKVLQYNVRGEAAKAVMPMFESKEVEDVDIITMQEPPYSQFTHSLTNPGEGFYLVFEGDETTRTYFFVNKRLDIDSQEVTYYGGNLYTLRITREGDTEGDLSIYNVYNPPPANRIGLFTIPLLKDVLGILSKYILLGNFNLYYTIQNELRRTTSYTETEELLMVTTRFNLLLLIPQGTIT